MVNDLEHYSRRTDAEADGVKEEENGNLLQDLSNWELPLDIVKIYRLRDSEKKTGDMWVQEKLALKMKEPSSTKT